MRTGCVLCGAEIPEGRHVCPNCEARIAPNKCQNCLFKGEYSSHGARVDLCKLKCDLAGAVEEYKKPGCDNKLTEEEAMTLKSKVERLEAMLFAVVRAMLLPIGKSLGKSEGELRGRIVRLELWQKLVFRAQLQKPQIEIVRGESDRSEAEEVGEEDDDE